MFERFTDRARRVIVLAQEESRLLRHHEIGTEHLLLGLLRDDDSRLAQAMEAVGVTLTSARAEVEQARGRGRRDAQGHIPFTPRAKRALEDSVHEAVRLGYNYAGPSDLLLALLRIADGRAAQILVALGVDLTALATTLDGIGAKTEPETRPSRVVASNGRSGGGNGRVPRRLHYLQRDDREHLLQRLLRYCRHDEGCDPARGCSCGLQALLDLVGEGDPPQD
jgi:ATP-dependent Clp protease ATP-binding subunit ClpC